MDEAKHASTLLDYAKNCPDVVDGGPGIEESLDAGADALLKIRTMRKELERERSRNQVLSRVVGDSKTVVVGLLALVRGECGSSVEDCIDVVLADRYLSDIARWLTGRE